MPVSAALLLRASGLPTGRERLLGSRTIACVLWSGYLAPRRMYTRQNALYARAPLYCAGLSVKGDIVNRKKTVMTVLLTTLASSQVALAGGGPLGIDHKLNYSDQGIWRRSKQTALAGVLVGGEVLGALWEGSDSRLGKNLYQSIDATGLGIVSCEVLKRAFTRLRPIQTDDPNQWFTHQGHSFPSSEVTLAASVVTPFVLEYGPDHPAVYALELIPLYDAIGRMKVQAHWQSDVLAGWAIGTAVGYYAHQRNQSFTVGILPRGITVGWRTRF